MRFDDFWSLPDRPRHPTEDRLVEPRDVAFVKVDAEGFDIEVFFSLQWLMQGPTPVPFFTIEFATKMADAGSVPCDAVKFVQHVYSLGYAFVDPADEPPAPKSLWAVLQDVEFDSFYDKPATVARRTVRVSNNEWWLMHATAPLPPGWKRAVESAA